jgi:hypothetical protein
LVFLLSQKVAGIHQHERVKQDFKTVDVLVEDCCLTLLVDEVEDRLKEMPRELERQHCDLEYGFTDFFNCDFVGLLWRQHSFYLFFLDLNL